MASGRNPRNKSASSEPRLRSTWQRSTSMSDKDDNLSIHSIPNELRPNNWDFSDWKPSGAFEQTKRRKKENPEREREQSLSQESPPLPSERQHTPSTFPRTRVVPGASGPQKNGLEPLRQHITFSDAEEVSLDGERNNERVIPQRRDRSLNFTRQDTSERVNTDTQTRLGAEGRIINQTPNDCYNNNEDKDDGPESSQIIGRLMQIRDYIKQANSMMESLKNSGDPQANREELDRVQKLASHLKEQELAYMDLLQQVFASKDNGHMVDGPLFRRDTTPAMESMEDVISVDLDVESETSETTTEMSPSGSSRPRIEDKLGLDSDEEDEEEDKGEISNPDSDSSESETMDSTVVSTSRPEWDFEDGVDNGAEGQDELTALRKQQELLKKLIHQQEQMKALKGRQAALRAMQQDEEHRLSQVRPSDLNDATQQLTRNIPEHDTDGTNLPPGLLEIRQQLNVLRNELKVQTPIQDKKQKNEMGSTLPDSQQDLRNKLEDLQDKKQHMDRLLTDLQALRSSQFEQHVNNTTVAEATHFEEHVQDGAAVSESAGNTANAAEDVLEIMEAREKLGKLQEVKDRLNQLRSLVQYYQISEDNSSPVQSTPHPEGSDLTRLTRDHRSADNHRPSQPRKPIEETAQRIPDGQADEQESSSDSESKLSSLGPWGDDPEIQEKVKKLRGAKEKLKQLQDLVSAVQRSPDAVQAISNSVADVTGSGDLGNPVPTDVSVSEGEVTGVQATNNSFYESKMQEQLQELEELRQERQRLLDVQDQLHQLHEQFVDEPEEKPKNIPAKKKPISPPPEQIAPDTSSSQQNGPTVTFSSNEEVYNKMRKQRLLREELRQKKQELEAIMKKDRNKRQYSRNQDNQSDTVSYTTDAFGASQSVDITVATWGGSTVDNLESITEGENADAANNTNDDDDDDAYPSDGIVQVEEEEEENETDSKSYSMSDDRRQRKDRKPSSQSRLKETYPQSTKTNKGKKSRSQDTWHGRKHPSSSAWPRRTEKHGSRSGEKIEDGDDSGWSQGNVKNLFEQQLEQMSGMCQNMLQSSTGSAQILPTSWSPSSGSNMRPSGIADLLQQQLQQQQMLMGMNQCYQQLSMHQMEIQNMQRQMNNMSQQMHDQSDWDLRNDSGGPEEPLLRPFPSTANRTQSAGYPQRNRTFSVQPQFPSDFHLRKSRDTIPGHTHGDDSVFENERTRAPSSTRLEGDGGLQGDFRHSSSATYTINPIAPQNDNGIQDRLKTADSLSGPDCWYPSTSAQKQRTTTLVASEPEDTVPKIDIQQLLNRLERRKRSEVGVEQSATRTNKQRSDVLEMASVEGHSEPLPGHVGKNKSPPYRPGLSAGISGTSYMDSLSTTSNASSAVSAARAGRSKKDMRRADDPSGISLFEALRETIYSEVATLISQNENRPHFLIELFRELQLFTSDYLRQNVLQAIKKVVSKFLVEENNELSMVTPPSWMNIPNDIQTASELTPSENNVPSDEEEEEAEKAVRVTNPVVKQVFDVTGSLDNDQFDYAEYADNNSPLSTPSNGYWESPFANDSLGDTVIHLDKALERMREYEKRAADLKARTSSHDEMHQELKPNNLGLEIKGVAVNVNELTEIAADQGSDSSEPMYPSIDTQQLDQQIKNIMTELIPVIKEHMDNICSPQLLAYIKRLVLSLTRQPCSNQEFTQFFHRQLGSILQDSLTKFEGRKMRECGEDLLVDLSEVLFNELAFSRLMQDLNDPMLAEKIRDTTRMDCDVDDREEVEGTLQSDTTESSTVNIDGEAVSTKLTLGTEEEDLGKARDDEFANAVQIKENDDKDDDTEAFKASAVQIELAVSETKPFTRIGSDEDDEDADESQSADDLSETAVSRSAKMEDYIEQDGREESEDEQVEVMNGRQEPLGDASPSQPVSVDGASEGDADQGARAEPSEKLPNGDAVNLSDLPSSLAVLSREVQRKTAEEQTDSVSAAVVTTDLPDHELAGDAQYLRTPDGDASR